MSWLLQLHETQPIAHAIGLISAVCLAGMVLGSVKCHGIGLGTSGVLFAGILFGHFGESIDHATLDFVKEFGLILFVFTIGLQLGPGFFAALRKQGVKWNLLAAAIVLMGVAGAPLAGWVGGFDPAAVIGLFSGASTNTPSLGAGTQALGSVPGIEAQRLALPALAYAVTYPTAIVGIILSLLLLKGLLRINLEKESADYAARNFAQHEPLERRTLVVTNPNLEDLALAEVPGRLEAGVTFARLRRGEETVVASGDMPLRMGDRLAVVGTKAGIAKIERVIGEHAEEDLIMSGKGISFRRVVATDRHVLGKTIGELGLDARHHVAVTRVTRADLEMTAVPGLRLQFGDKLQIVGRPEDLDEATRVLGNSMRDLNETHFIPVFIGLLFGILLGSMPFFLPGIPQPVRLGLAGGPLIVALLLGRIGRIGGQVWHMPENTNLAFREFGIALFFAAVGLAAGERFFETVFSTTGLQWLLGGLAVTVIPLLLAGLFARFVWKINYLDLSGLIAGSMTDPPALAFATNLAGSNAPAVAYATVYPLTTLLRILSAQMLVIFYFA